MLRFSGKRTRVRLCFANGPWQVISATCALEQAVHCGEADEAKWENKLVLCCSSGREVVETMEELARPLKIWDEVIFAYDQLFTPPQDVWPLPVDELFNSCRALCQTDHADEVWVGHLFNYNHRLIFESFPHAGIVHYESGVDFPQTVTLRSRYTSIQEWRSWPGLIKSGTWRDHFTSLRLCDYRLDRRHLRRLKRRYIGICQHYPVSRHVAHVPVSTYSVDTIEQVLRKIRDGLPNVKLWRPRPDDNRPRVLLLGQIAIKEFYDRADACMQAYSVVIEKLIASGYVVYWKEHPRSLLTLGDKMQARFGTDDFVQMHVTGYLPVELLVENGAFAACVAIHSSSLYYLQAIHGFKSHTCADCFLPFGWSERVEAVMRAIMDEFPSWKELVETPQGDAP